MTTPAAALPEPDACHWCDQPARGHRIRTTAGQPHRYTPPTPRLHAARTRAIRLRQKDTPTVTTPITLWDAAKARAATLADQLTDRYGQLSEVLAITADYNQVTIALQPTQLATWTNWLEDFQAGTPETRGYAELATGSRDTVPVQLIGHGIPALRAVSRRRDEVAALVAEGGDR